MKQPLCDFCLTNPRECTFSHFQICGTCFQSYIDDETDYDTDDSLSSIETVIIDRDDIK